MTASRPATLAELQASGYGSRSVKDELRENLVRKLQAREALFPGIQGYDDSVVPQIVNAILARHDFILLGLRGQAKSRILRQLVELLDDAIPILAGSEVNDDPFAPISKYGRQLIEERGQPRVVLVRRSRSRRPQDEDERERARKRGAEQTRNASTHAAEHRLTIRPPRRLANAGKRSPRSSAGGARSEAKPSEGGGQPATKTGNCRTARWRERR